jgi:hypothetical protein
MWNVIGAIIVVATAMAAVKLAIVLLFLAGLIFRPKETYALLALGALLALWSRSPVAGFIVTVLLVLLAIYGAAQRPET